MRFLVLLLALLAVSAKAENFVVNGSFECFDHGWYTWGAYNQESAYGNDSGVYNHVISTNGVAQHGNNAIFMGSRMLSWPMYLTNGTYTETFRARATASYTLKYDVVPTYLVTSSPTPSSTITTSWQSFTNVFVVATNGFYCAKFQDNGGAIIWIDSVQVQSGSSATAFNTGPTIEFGFRSTNSENVYYSGDSLNMQCKIWSREATTTNMTIHYDIVSSIWNTNVVSGDISTNSLAVGSTVINLTLPTNILGQFRVVGYVTNMDNTWEETSYSVLPYVAQSGINTNGLLGLDSMWSAYHLGLARRLGFSHIRLLSQTPDFRWVTIFPTLTTTNVYPALSGTWTTDYVFDSITNSGMTVTLCLVGGNDGTWYPETNASTAVMIGDYTNYVGRLVHRYNVAPYNVKRWEIWNEPQQNPRDAIALYTPAIYAQLMTNAAKLIRAIDSTAYIIGGGGLSQESQWTNIWDVTATDVRTMLNSVSFHSYPHASGDNDPNATEDQASDSTSNFRRINQAVGVWSPGLDILNTETAVSGIGNYHTKGVAYIYPYYWSAKPGGWTSESWFNELENRGGVVNTDRYLYNAICSWGWGYKVYYPQYQRITDETSLAGTTPSILEFNGTIRPHVIAGCIAANLLKNAGLGRVTNSSQYYLEAYLFTNTLGTVIPIWNCDRGNRTLTFTNSDLAVLDTMGNQISTNSLTMVVTRSPRYLVSGSLTMSQLKATVENATIATNIYTDAPGLTVDMSPIGNTVVWGGNTNWFKATAFDSTVMQYGWDGVSNNVSQTNVQLRWTLNDGNSWSPWGSTNHFSYVWPVAGNYRVGWQAKNIKGTTTATVYTPNFGDMSIVPDTSKLNVSGTIRVGTITVVP